MNCLMGFQVLTIGNSEPNHVMCEYPPSSSPNRNAIDVFTRSKVLIRTLPRLYTRPIAVHVDVDSQPYNVYLKSAMVKIASP